MFSRGFAHESPGAGKADVAPPFGHEQLASSRDFAFESGAKESERRHLSRFLQPTLLLAATPTKILYCRCAFAQVIPEETKNEVLKQLCDSGVTFESVADLCEMSARRDSRLKGIFDDESTVRIAACEPRAVKWLFHQADVPFPDDESVEVLNMRDAEPGDIVDKLLDQ